VGHLQRFHGVLSTLGLGYTKRPPTIRGARGTLQSGGDNCLYFTGHTLGEGQLAGFLVDIRGWRGVGRGQVQGKH